MKILIICGEYFNTSNGLSLSTQRFVKEFLRMGEEVRVLSSNHGGISDYSVPVMHIPLIDDIMEKQNYHFAKPDSKIMEDALSWADIVHIEDPFPLSVQAAKTAYKKGIPITGTYHLYPENMTASVPIFDFSLSNRNIMNVFRWGVYQYCYAIQCPTEKVRDRLEKCGYKSKLYVISNGIPSDFIAEFPCRKKNDLFMVISVGRYSNEKDQKTLIKAVGASKYAADIQLILAGRGPLENEYRLLGKQLPVEPVMRFYSQDELREEVRRADLYVHCANVEIEGMGCMEAFAQGTIPVIAESELSSTAGYALREQSKYEAGNVEDLVRKIDYWHEHREEMYTIGMEYIELTKTLSIEESARKVLSMMKEASAHKTEADWLSKQDFTNKPEDAYTG